MMAILMVIQVFVAIALIGVVLIQRSEGGGLGIGSSQGMGAFMSGRGTANLLTRTTAILAAIFLGLSLTMAVLNRGSSSAGSGILSQSPPPSLPAAPAGGPVPTAPVVPTAPATPSAPSAGAPSAGAPSAGATPAPAIPTPAASAPAASPPSGAPAAPAAPAGPAVPH